MTLPADIANNTSGKLYIVGDKGKALLFFPYEMVTPTTVAHALEAAGVNMNEHKFFFSPETPDTARAKRMDSKRQGDRHPDVLAFALSTQRNPAEYICIKYGGEASDRGKQGLLPEDKPFGTRRQRRTKPNKSVDKRFTPKKKKR